MRTRKILIIDDDPQLVELLKLIFAKEGAQVYAAADGPQGLNAFCVHRPDLVIIDVMMPGMDGWQVCSHLRETSDVPILLLSALGRDQDVALGLARGADDYVTKPFSPTTLLTRAQALLSQPPSTQADQPLTYRQGTASLHLQGQRAFAG
jgi:DNA-binding response OmpR family regulator